MTVALIILALLQPVCFWLGSWITFRVQNNRSPAVSFGGKVEVEQDNHDGDTSVPIHQKGRPIL